MSHVPLQVEAIDRTLAKTMAQVAMPLLRIALAITYLWFGVLKLVGHSPVEKFVGDTVPILPRKPFVRALGLWEMLIGLALLFRLALRPTLLLFFVQIAGTFATFIMQPQRTFRNGNPLLLTTEGEFVIKNLVLIAAGLAVGSTIRRDDETLPANDQEAPHHH